MQFFKLFILLSVIFSLTTIAKEPESPDYFSPKQNADTLDKSVELVDSFKTKENQKFLDDSLERTVISDKEAKELVKAYNQKGVQEHLVRKKGDSIIFDELSAGNVDVSTQNTAKKKNHVMVM